MSSRTGRISYWFCEAGVFDVGPPLWFEDNAGSCLGEINGKVMTIHNEYKIKDG